MSFDRSALLKQVYLNAGLSEAEASALSTGVKWSDNSAFPVQSALLDADQLPGLHGGLNAKWDATAISNYVKNKQIPSTRVTVAQNGTNTPGSAIYATLDYAISQIPNDGTIYVIDVYKPCAIDNLVIKPNVAIYFNKHQVEVVGSVSLDPTWSSGGIFVFENAFNLSFPASVNLDFDDVAASFSLFEFIGNVTASTTTLSVNGSTAGATICLISNNFGLSDQFKYDITNCYGAISSGAIGVSNITNSSNSAGGNYSVQNVTQLGALTVTCSSDNFLFFHENCKATDAVTYQSASTGTLTVGVKGVTYLGSAPQVDNGTFGGSVQFSADILNKMPVLLNGATYTPTSLANSILANFTPDNYTPIDPSVEGHLEGIDNAIILQRAYDNGSGEILLDTAKPLAAQKDDGSPVTLWQIDALAEQMWFRDLSAVDTPAASAVFDVLSTTKGSRPCPSMTMAERDAIASPANGLTVFITDVSPQRLYIYNGAWTPLAYLSDIPTVPSPLSGIYTPTFTNLASFNAATFSNILSSYDTVDDIVGNWCCITTHFIVQATAISGVLGVSIPLGSDFTGTGQAQFVGGTIFESVSQAVLPGPFRGVDSATGNAIRVALTIPNTSLNLNLDVSLTLKYLLQ